MANFQPLPGNTYYFGWRHKWGPLPTLCGKWQVLEQIHLAGTGATGGPVPFGLHVDGCDTNMHFQYQDASGTPHDFLVLPFPLNSWHTFVYHEKWSESETDGYVEFWFDGTMQTLTNGTTRYPSAWCFPNSTSYWKWGVYRSGSGGPIGTSYAYLSAAKAGTTYADVAPVPIGTTVDFEAESLAYTTSGPTVTTQSDTNASGGVITYFNATGSSQWVEFATGTIKAGTYSLAYEYKQNGNRGQHTITIDGTQVGGTVDEYSSSSGYTTKTIGTVNFTTTGTHKIRLNVTGKNASASGYVLAPDAFDFNAQ